MFLIDTEDDGLGEAVGALEELGEMAGDGFGALFKGDNALEAGIPESFNVLVKEMQSLGMDVKVGYSNQLDQPSEGNALASLG